MARAKHHVIDGAELKRQLVISQQQKQPTKELIDLFYKMSRHMATAPNFRGYSFVEDMIQFGAATATNKYDRFDLGREYPHAYFSRIIYHSFVHVLNVERKQRDAVKALRAHYGLPELGHGEVDDEGGID